MERHRDDLVCPLEDTDDFEDDWVVVDVSSLNRVCLVVEQADQDVTVLLVLTLVLLKIPPHGSYVLLFLHIVLVQHVLVGLVLYFWVIS